MAMVIDSLVERLGVIATQDDFHRWHPGVAPRLRILPTQLLTIVPVAPGILRAV
jgi:hypothetical protein